MSCGFCPRYDASFPPVRAENLGIRPTLVLRSRATRLSRRRASMERVWLAAAPLFAICLCAGCSQSTRDESKNADRQITTSLCILIRHIGVSDKPIAPIVIGDRNPSSDRASALLQLSDTAGLDPVMLFVVPRAVVVACQGAIRKCYAAGSSTPSPTSPAFAEFGTFEVTLITPSARETVVAPPDLARRMFHGVLAESKDADRDLTDYIAGVLRRIQPDRTDVL